MNKRIVFIPLDSRPVNTFLPEQLAGLAGMRLVRPPMKLLGDLKNPADRPRVIEWLSGRLEKGADALIVSVDLLAYGGLVASRKPDASFRDSLSALNNLKKIRRRFRDLPIFAFNIILRDAITITDDATFEEWKKQMKGAGRGNAGVSPLRRRNFEINMEMVRWAGEKVFDFLVIGKEDTAEGNPNAAEFAALKAMAAKRGGGRVSIQTGADEIAALLVARYVTGAAGRRPAFYIDAAESDLKIVPRYEPAKLGNTLRAQVKAAGGRLVSGAEKADAVIVPRVAKNQKDLFLEQLKGKEIKEAAIPAAWLKKIEKHVEAGRAVGVVDAVVLNGASRAVAEGLLKCNLFFRLAGYSGWNTTANSAGNVIGQTAIVAVARKHSSPGVLAERICAAHLERVVNDYIFSAVVRGEMAGRFESPMAMKCPEKENRTLGSTMERHFRVFMKKYVENRELEVFGGDGVTIKVTSCRLEKVYFPWGRLFEAVTVTKTDISTH